MAAEWSVVDADPLSFLIGPTPSATFLKDTWEHRSAVFKATAPRKKLLPGLFGLNELFDVARRRDAEGQPFLFGSDVNAARYVDGVRETPNQVVADPATLQRLFNDEGCTLQVHQPQRFDDAVWRLCAALEAQLGCLVGCNAYVTPADKQGLAPHWDDVELFVLQTEGHKRWRVYAPGDGPLEGAVLPNRPSGDLVQEQLGAPALEVTLGPGDVLYLPRGTVHQAAAAGTAHSAHLTVSTYQRWTWGDLGQYAVSVSLADPELQRELPDAVKAGLPHGFLYRAALADAEGAVPRLTAAPGAKSTKAKGDKSTKAKGGEGAQAKAPRADSKPALARQLAAVFRGLAEYLERGGGGLGGRVVCAAADAMAEDFMRSRLPPHPAQLPDAGPPPGMQDAVRCRGAGLFRLVPLLDAPGGDGGGGCSDSECEEEHGREHGHGHGPHHDEEGAGRGLDEESAFVRLVGCLRNDRASHMLEDDGDDEEIESDGEDEDDYSSDRELEWEPDAAVAADQLGPQQRAAEGAGDRGDGAAERGEEAEADADGDAASDDAADELLDALEEEEVGAEEEDAGAGTDEDEEAEDGGEEEVEEDGEEDGDQREDLVFPASFAPALLQVLGEGAGAVRVADLPLAPPELRLQVAQALWEAGAVCTVPLPPEEAAPGAGASTGRKRNAGGVPGKRGKRSR